MFIEYLDIQIYTKKSKIKKLKVKLENLSHENKLVFLLDLIANIN